MSQKMRKIIALAIIAIMVLSTVTAFIGSSLIM